MSIKKIGNEKYLIDVCWSEGGKRFRLRRQVLGSLKATRQWEQKIKNNAKLGKILTNEKKEKRQLFADFTEEWFETYVKANNKLVEQINKRSFLKIHLIPCFGNFFLDEVMPRDIEKYKALKVSQGYTPKTINNHLICLQKIFQCAVDWNLIDKNPVRGIQKLKDRKEKWQFLDFEEAEQFLQAVPEKWKPLFLCALRTGMRQGEILALRWDDIDWKRKVIIVRNSLFQEKLYPTKSFNSREIPMTYDLFEALMTLRDNESAFVFPAEDKGPLHRKTLTRPLRTAIKRSGIKRIRFHDLRHTYASHLVISGVPIKTVQELLGHADLKMTLRYAHLTPQCKNEAVEKLESHLFNQTCVKNVTLLDSFKNAKSAIP